MSIARKRRNAGSSGCLNHQAKLNEVVVAKMRALYELKGLSPSAIAKLVNVHTHTAYEAILGTTWKHVCVAPGSRRTTRKLSDATVTAARELYASGLATQRQIAAMVGLFQNPTRLMLIGETYRHVPMPSKAERFESVEEHVAAGIVKRLHIVGSPEVSRAIMLGFRAGHHLAQLAFDRRTEEEVMGAGNSEYDGNRLAFDDLTNLHHAFVPSDEH